MLARLTREEKTRCDFLNILFPPIFAVVPSTDTEGIPLPSSGWMLCRSVSTKDSLQHAEFFAAENEYAIPDTLLLFHDKFAVMDVPNGIIRVLNPVVPETLEIGTTVICQSNRALKEYGCIADLGIRNTYLVRLASSKIRRFHRSKLQVLGGSMFYFNTEHNYSSWRIEDIFSVSHSLNPSRIDGSTWDEVHSQGIFWRYFTAFDEFIDGHSGKGYYVNIDLQEKESAARTIQKLVRQKLCIPVS